MKHYPTAYLFSFLKELTLLNNRFILIQYSSGETSYDVIFEGSKETPRKTKKKLRNILNKKRKSEK